MEINEETLKLQYYNTQRYPTNWTRYWGYIKNLAYFM